MLGTDACKAGAVNNLLHLLFKEITVQFNNKTVSNSSNMYVYCCTWKSFSTSIRTLTNTGVKPRDGTKISTIK